MPRFFTPRNVAVGTGVAAAFFFLPRATSKVVPSDFNSVPGVQNIGDRFSAGGGSTTHSPGVATKRGDISSTHGNQERSNGVDSAAFSDAKADQKVGEPGALGKAWHQTHYGNDKGK